MTKIYAYLRHNSGVCLAALLIPFLMIYAYSCQSVVVSTIDPMKKITRNELVAEIDFILAQAEIKFADLDRQDLVRDTIFNSVLDLASGKSVNPIGVMSMIAVLFGAGAGVDNIRKRTHINTLKGGNINAKIKEAIEKDSQN